jgi:murein DD-endopeptidase MepM/ murein hydrolase activator NlpD
MHGRAQTWLRTASIVCALASHASAGVARTPLQWQPLRLTNGSPVLFELVAPADVQSISGVFLGHNFRFFHLARTRSWYALAGVPLQTGPGSYDFEAHEIRANEKSIRIERKIRIARAAYPKITVTVAKQYTEPSPVQVARIAADKGTKEKVFESVTADRLWSGSFLPPLSATVSDLFGTERVFNGQVQSRHQGLDYAVPAGTPVRAINRGVVLLAEPMFFEGNFLVVDHGQGLLSLYLHLSEFKVKAGERVEPGEVIALSGGTGRATGAHLHLAIRWQGIYLDPAILLKLHIPPG